MGSMIYLFDIFVPSPFVVLLAVFPVVVYAYIFGQLKKPILEIFPFLEHEGLLMDPQKGFLHDIQGVLLVVKIGIGELKDLPLEKPGQRHERLSIPVLDLFDKEFDLIFLLRVLNLHGCFLYCGS
jgi:hypothetical protein